MGADKEDGITTVLPVEVIELIKKLEEDAACKAYTVYCATVGGKAYNGDPLPTWAVLVSDSQTGDAKKQAVVAGWRAAANATVAFALRKFLVSADNMLMAAVDKTAPPVEGAVSESTTTPAPAAVPVESGSSATPDAKA